VVVVLWEAMEVVEEQEDEVVAVEALVVLSNPRRNLVLMAANVVSANAIVVVVNVLFVTVHLQRN
jgi:voltage-gated potassium channel Kch